MPVVDNQEELFKVLKISGKNTDFSIIQNGNEYPLKKWHIKQIINRFVRDIREGYIRSIPNFIEDNKDRIRVKVNNNMIGSNISKNILNKGIDLKIDNELSIFIPYTKDNIESSVNYMIAKDIKKNLKEGKLIAISNLPFLVRLKTVRGGNSYFGKYVNRVLKRKGVKIKKIENMQLLTYDWAKIPDQSPYDKVFQSVIKEFELNEDEEKKGKRTVKVVDVIISIKIAKNTFLKVKEKIKLRKRDFSNNNSKYQILKRLKSHEYKIKYLGFGYKQKKGAYFIISYNFSKFDKNFENVKNAVMGIDLGQSSLVYYAIAGTKKRGDIAKTHNDYWKTKVFGIWKKRGILQNQYSTLKNTLKHNKDDKSLKAMLKKVKKELDGIRNYEKNFMESLNKKLASQLINIAIKENIKTIVLEDLSLSNEEKNALAFPKWNYYQLQTYIENKAKEYGIGVKKINPAYTSQMCVNCGFIGFIKDMVRPRRDKFTCPKCNFSEYSDYVGALNVATENIEEIIRNYIIKDIEILEGRKLKKDEKNKKIHYLQAWRRRLAKELLKNYLNVKNKSIGLKKLLQKLENNDKDSYNLFVKDLRKFKTRLLENRIR